MLWIVEELPYFEWSILLLEVDSVADPIGSFGEVGGLFEVDSSRSAVFIKRQQQPDVSNLASRLSWDSNMFFLLIKRSFETRG